MAIRQINSLKSEEDFVHKYSPSFTATAILECEKWNYTYYLCSGEELEDGVHKCQNFIKNCGIKHVVGIPVKKPGAAHPYSILKLSYKDIPTNSLLDNNTLQTFSKMVSDYIIHCDQLLLTQKMQDILHNLVKELRVSIKT